MADSFIGEIRAFGFNFAPQDWMSCDGQTLPISQNQALYAVIGNTYGGTAPQTFGIPNLSALGVIGQVGGVLNHQQGSNTVTLTQQTMPSHTHALNGNTTRAASAVPTAHLPTRFVTPNNCAFVPIANAGQLTPLSPEAVSAVGSGGAHQNLQPYLAINFCISLQGAWPEHP
ncbi:MULTISPECIES: phage tail protein [unclassified Undibacterium]|uniref:phage tail protein n=1 Tax=unclassified Undibacterium TaxID=2630295 RepID=UPI002AC9BF86|nr:MULTISPECIES: tail fiber protein [unclassified Undibacterium]MEB0137873.1 tail fiber protein [Undibacterium sp. CCC2.1]MEB0170936.1 tail fiber protein [Undibacterium sp. CCC1.1]MEB0174981.1 tail fiber protein [Undibacterium sp. CCC3.4]MEB0215813.1 tail fiber protein [Undibacterium sp. 5I2]WPX44787.1 tail fiber protein [Undibacterium sp. CCC3.4]